MSNKLYQHNYLMEDSQVVLSPMAQSPSKIISWIEEFRMITGCGLMSSKFLYKCMEHGGMDMDDENLVLLGAKIKRLIEKALNKDLDSLTPALIVADNFLSANEVPGSLDDLLGLIEQGKSPGVVTILGYIADANGAQMEYLVNIYQPKLEGIKNEHER